MAANGEIELKWADGEHKFNIAKLRCVLELEEKCNCGFAEIYQRLVQGKWFYNDIRETLRLGLIGGGMLPDRALVMINRYCDDRPFAENVLPAQAVIMAALVGVQGDNLEKKAEADPATESRSMEKTADLSDPLSMDLGPPSDSTRVN